MLERCYVSRLNLGGLGTRGRVDEVEWSKVVAEIGCSEVGSDQTSNLSLKVSFYFMSTRKFRKFSAIYCEIFST